MKNPCPFLLGCLGSLVTAHAAQLVYEPFDYLESDPLTGLSGGTGWSGAWFVDGESVSAVSPGLGYTDAAGNQLTVSGLCADTTATATTRSLRDLETAELNDVWISFLFQVAVSNSKFEGLSFYRGTQPSFTVSNPSNTTTPGIFLVNNNTGGASVSTGHGAFGQTHLVVLKLTKGGGTGGLDRIEAFIDPIMVGNPTSPTTVDGANFDFDRIRIAGQDGSTLLVDEFRVGESFADVTPNVPVGGQDSDNDGLSDTEEAVLGLDPQVSDAALIAAIQAHPDWFDLYTPAGILELGNGGVMLQQGSDDPVDLIFEVQQTENLGHWGVLETFNRQVELPSGKNFLRVTLQDL